MTPAPAPSPLPDSAPVNVPVDGDYPNWKAPAEDGQRLLWPDASRIVADSISNAKQLASADVRLQGVALSELRARQREWIGHKDFEQPLIATGHQTELYHPGVWVKDVLIDAIARKMNGVAYHLAVDTDAPKHLHLRWPGGNRPITDDDNLHSAAWTGLLAGPSPAHARGLGITLTRASGAWSFKPVALNFLSALHKLAMEEPPLPEALTNAMHQTDWELGLTQHAVMLSPICLAEPYLVFAHHLLARAGEVAAEYNASLAAYRAAHGLTTHARPMPDLHVAADTCETPFWCDSLLHGTRQRAQVRPTADGKWTLQAGNAADAFCFDPTADGWDAAANLANFLRRHQMRLAPRALTLTMFLRLLVADQFVHGIGGGRYDQVTDRLIARLFGLAPPRFAVTTATLYFPSAQNERRVNLRPMFQEGRRLRHGMLNRNKRQLVQQIAAAPRRSRQRAELFQQMHQLLASDTNTPALRQWEQQFRAAEEQKKQQAALFDRELFYGIQPAGRLQDLIAQYRKEF